MLRGLALNRQPGLHFPGNFLGIHFDRVGRLGARLSLDPGHWCCGAGGETDRAALTVLADLALGASIRAQLSPEARLATVSLGLQFTAVPRTGRLRADGEFQGFFTRGSARLGMSRVAVHGDAGQVCFGTGTFMALQPPKNMKLHPVPLRHRKSPEPPRLNEAGLEPEERQILGRADAALAARGVFIENFWGIGPRAGKGTLEYGLHVGNRVGHAQGGILLALAAATAGTALPAHWRLSGISAWNISPGEGKALRAKSQVIHQGRLTAVVRTQIAGKGRHRVLDVVTTHCASA